VSILGLFHRALSSLTGSREPTGLGHNDLQDKLAPTLVTPSLMQGARVGRCLPLPPHLALAFAMGTHPRLGPASMSGVLPEVVFMCVEACRGWPEGAAGRFGGVLRLLGGGRLVRERCTSW
jgi:hypothetical protein